MKQIDFSHQQPFLNAYCFLFYRIVFFFGFVFQFFLFTSVKRQYVNVQADTIKISPCHCNEWHSVLVCISRKKKNVFATDQWQAFLMKDLTVHFWLDSFNIDCIVILHLFPSFFLLFHPLTYLGHHLLSCFLARNKSLMLLVPPLFHHFLTISQSGFIASIWYLRIKSIFLYWKWN